MKRFLLFLTLISVAYVCSPAAIAAVANPIALAASASDSGILDAVPVATVLYESPVPITEGAIEGIFGTFFALAAFIPVAVQFLRKLLVPGISGIWAQVFSWTIGIFITLGGWLLHLGFLSDLNFWMALLYGAGACLAANGVFDTGLITAVFGLFKRKAYN